MLRNRQAIEGPIEQIVTVDAEWLRLLVMAAVSTAAVVIVAYAGPATAPERLLDFYRRVEPPGWWSRTAMTAGDEPRAPLRALAIDLGHVTACAVSVYGWLVGGGKLLLHPAEWLIAIVFLVVGTLAVPLWWRRLSVRREQSATV